MFSFHATKLFHTAEGGALTFNDPNLKQRIDLLKNFGIKNENEVIMPGINGKMNEIQAALGLVVLDMIDLERQKRMSLYHIYTKLLNGVPGIKYLSHELVGCKSGAQYFIIRIDKDVFGCSRDEVYDTLKKYNVHSRKYFYPLCSDYPCYRYLPSSMPSALINAQKAAAEVLALPFYGDLPAEYVEKICEIIVRCLR